MEPTPKPGETFEAYAVAECGDYMPVVERATVTVGSDGRAHFSRPLRGYARARTLDLELVYRTPEAAIAAWRFMLDRQAAGFEEMARRIRARANEAPRVES